MVTMSTLIPDAVGQESTSGTFWIDRGFHRSLITPAARCTLFVQNARLAREQGMPDRRSLADKVKAV